MLALGRHCESCNLAGTSRNCGTGLSLQAGICILEEAGGRCFGGKNTALAGEHDRELIGACSYLRGMPRYGADRVAGRKYLFMRAIAPAEVCSVVQLGARALKVPARY